jgi:hypothetical protein
VIVALQNDFWVRHVPYRVSGLWLGRQLVVVRLRSRELWVHSPIPWNEELRAQLATLGDVRHVVGPNCLHDECLKEFQAEYPDAVFHAAPGLAASRPDIRFASTTLSDEAPPAWNTVMDQHLVHGMPRLNEIVFLHRPTRTLIVTDLAFNLGPEGPWFTALAMRLNGAWGHFGPSRFCKSLMRDRAAVRKSLDAILRWDFDRVLVGHGQTIETGGKEALRAAFAFL